MYAALVLLMCLIGEALTYEKRSAQFSLCPNRRSDYMSVIGEKRAWSKFQCAAECMSVEECKSANFISDKDEGRCQLLQEDLNEVDCSISAQDSAAEVIKLKKDCPKNTTTGCHYGQPHDGTSCVCGPGFSGTFCENPPRDCNDVTTNGNFYIYPKVLCEGIPVYCYERSVIFIDTALNAGFTTNSNANWDTYKGRFGAVNDNYWLGLDNAHAITVSGKYLFELRVFYGSNVYTAFYNDFVIDSEAKDYAIHYTSSNVSTSLTDIIFDNAPFRTNDRNDNGCVATHGAAFWYASTCSWPSPLSGAFPFNNQLTNFTNFLCHLHRMSA